MTVYAAFLRAINVGGTGKLPMIELRALCEDAGFAGARTYIQSGNVVLRSKLVEGRVQATLAKALAAKMGKPVGVHVRSAAALADVQMHNPFAGADPSRVLVVFLDEEPAKSELARVVIPGREALALRGRDVYIHYPDGIGTSKLKVPFAKAGTARNLNTIAKLVELAAEMDDG